LQGITGPGLVGDALPNWTRTANGRNGGLESVFYCTLNDSKRCRTEIAGAWM